MSRKVKCHDTLNHWTPKVIGLDNFIKGVKKYSKEPSSLKQILVEYDCCSVMKGLVLLLGTGTMV